MDNIDKVYTEKCLTDYVWDKQGDSALQVLIYDDDLLQKFAEINDINLIPQNWNIRHCTKQRKYGKIES